MSLPPADRLEAPAIPPCAPSAHVRLGRGRFLATQPQFLATQPPGRVAGRNHVEASDCRVPLLGSPVRGESSQSMTDDGPFASDAGRAPNVRRAAPRPHPPP